MYTIYEMKLSKSAVMLYNYCPYKFKRVYIDKCEEPETQLLLKGTIYHKARAKYLETVDELKLTSNYNENYKYIRSLLPLDKDIIYDNIAISEAKRSVNPNTINFKPVEIEKKYKTVFCDSFFSMCYEGDTISDITNLLTDEQIEKIAEEYHAMPVLVFIGKIDDLYLEGDNTYNIKEFKTGNFTTDLSKIRKELILYSKILEPHLSLPVNYISYHYALENEYRIEKIQKRSVIALKKLMFKIVESMLSNQYEKKYYKSACDNKCQFADECKLNLMHGR